MWLLVVMVLASFAEVISIGALLPFLSVMVAPEKIFKHDLASPVISLFHVTDEKQLLLLLTIFFILASLASGAMRVTLLWLQTRLGFAIGADFSSQIYKKTLYQPYSVHIMRNSSQVIAGIGSKTSSVIGSTVQPLLTVVSGFLILGSVLTVLIIINPVVALGCFAGFGFLYASIMSITKKRLLRDSELISHESNKVLKALQEGLGGIRDVLIDGSQVEYYKIYRDADIPLRKSQANVQIIGGAPRFLIESLGMALIAYLAYGLANQGSGIASAIPVLGAMALGSQKLLPIMQQLYSSWTGIRGGQASLIDVLDLLDQPLPEGANSSLTKPIEFSRSIELKRVSFSYARASSPVLDKIDLKIFKGSTVGFIGTTGSGKSTLLDVIMGLLEPAEGALLVDGIMVVKKNQRAWQSHISHVPQSIFLVDGSVAENIAFGVARDDIDYERIRNAASKAKIAEIVESWPLKYETFVGERGVRLSGGQRQRIGIARALYKQADVIVLDEATSALDNETESDVMDSIAQIGSDVTTLIVAHRLSTLKQCDQIVELANGKIKRCGTYAEIVLASSSR